MITFKKGQHVEKSHEHNDTATNVLTLKTSSHQYRCNLEQMIKIRFRSNPTLTVPIYILNYLVTPEGGTQVLNSGLPRYNSGCKNECIK